MKGENQLLCLKYSNDTNISFQNVQGNFKMANILSDCVQHEIEYVEVTNIKCEKHAPLYKSATQ